jgi:hypothetical protein
VRLVTKSPLNLTPYRYPDKIKVSTHKEDTMKALGILFSGMFKTDATSNYKLQSEWERARHEAARFGPSHVAEIDAIFSRQS